MRRVAAAREQQDFHAPGASLDGFDLLFRPVLVLVALHQQDRGRDPRQELLQVPLAELRIQPRASPATAFNNLSLGPTARRNDTDRDGGPPPLTQQ